MRIISKFADYYDYIGNLYAYDDGVIYNRLNLDIDKVTVNGVIPDFKGMQYYGKSIRLNKHEYEFIRLVVFGKMYTCVNIDGKKYDKIYYKEQIGTEKIYKILSPSNPDHLEIIEYLKTKKSSIFFRGDREYQSIDDFYCYQSDLLIDVCKQIKQPIFLVDRIQHASATWKPGAISTIVVLDQTMPILKELGFSAIMKPEILYQEIEYFIANVLRDNPDIVPPVQVSDKHKITQHGFDFKQSFRHRK